MKRLLWSALIVLSGLVAAGYAPAYGRGWSSSAAHCCAAAPDYHHTGTLTAYEGATNDDFGHAVALDGPIALVGAPDVDTWGRPNQGAAYVYTQQDGAWGQRFRLVAQNGARDDRFGYAVALAGNTAAIGAPTEMSNGDYRPGFVTLFVRSGANWIERDTLSAPDAQPGDRFGSALAFDGQTLCVAAPGANLGSVVAGGAVYVFERGGSGWQFVEKLVLDDPRPFDTFGQALALDGDTLVVGAGGQEGRYGTPGRATFFTRTAAGWQLQDQVVSSVYEDGFSRALALEGDTAAVGAWFTAVKPGQLQQGAVYVYRRSGTDWQLEQVVAASDGDEFDLFGAAVALRGDLLFAGAPAAVDPDSGIAGTVQLFVYDGTLWQPDARLTHASGDNGGFGDALAADGTDLLIGAPWADGPYAQTSGSAFMFKDAWTATDAVYLALVGRD